MGNNENEVKDIVADLAAKRDRSGLEAHTSEERAQLLNEIYDGLLYLWKQCVITGTAKGTGAICMQLQGARLELDSINGGVKPTGFDFMKHGTDFTLDNETSDNN